MAKALGNDVNDRWLEPSVGTGALLSALSHIGVKREQITGLDLDTVSRPLDRLARVQRGIEFLKWSRSTPDRFDKIIANPPYIPIERLQKTVRSAACRVTALDDLKVTAGGNTWSAFLVAALGLLRSNGSLCFLLPAGWDFANYAAPLRSKIGRYFETVEIFRSRAPLFHAENIQEGAVILIAHRFSRSRSSSMGIQPIVENVTRQEYATLDSLLAGLRERSRTISKKVSAKAAAIPSIPSPMVRDQADTTLLENLLTVHLGGVTGDSKYFLLNDERRIELGLPITSLRPVVSRAKHLSTSKITAQRWARLKSEGERVWLFHPPPSLENHAAVKSYISKGKDSGECHVGNQKVASRSPWFRTKLPEQIDGFLSGMSRFGPWVCFRGMKSLTATNTLYVVKFNGVKSEEERSALALTLMTTRAAEQLDGLARRYADGLVKYEPGDLRKVHVQCPSSRRGAAACYDRAVRALLSENVKLARSIADDWCGK